MDQHLMSEFNLHKAKLKLVKKALKRYATKTEAAAALGITTRTLAAMIRDFDLE